MPNFDGTGPQGQGPLTGRGKGDCENSDSGGPGRGRGCPFMKGCGFGRGFRQGMMKRKPDGPQKEK
ncbi:DUF5320 domain-containing protein [Candidatus Peregrinibacteria bacterium]|jgi:hypothetical protein|nr:DUF5320 domain-containing protein [Candidatus Peregrinibacteria bacterium]MBT7702847.1 DUF5320 domain-containing protein [Candidatus Peregrinibacteria bacterium]